MHETNKCRINTRRHSIADTSKYNPVWENSFAESMFLTFFTFFIFACVESYFAILRDIGYIFFLGFVESGKCFRIAWLYFFYLFFTAKSISLNLWNSPSFPQSLSLFRFLRRTYIEISGRILFVETLTCFEETLTRRFVRRMRNGARSYLRVIRTEGRYKKRLGLRHVLGVTSRQNLLSFTISLSSVRHDILW